MKINSIPLFYHIPKNSGTYVYHSMLNAARLYNENKVQVIRVILEEKFILAKLILIDNLNFLKEDDKFTSLNSAEITWNLRVEDLTEDILQRLSIHSVVIEARGFRHTETSLKSLFLFLAKFNLHKFIILREPFSREQSLYNYLTSDKSKHECTHGIFKNVSFEEHVMSKQIQDSWLIRSLLNIPMGEQLTEDHFNKTCEKMCNLNVYDIKDTDEVVKEMLLKCFNIQNFDIESAANKKHDNIYKKIKFEELPLSSQNIFKERKYWDQKLYNYFIK
jgi:hypothetical protein